LATTGNDAAVERPASRADDAGAGVISGMGPLLVAVGAIGIIVSIFLKWEDFSLGGRHQTAKATGVPLKFLIDYTTSSKDPSLVVILGVSAALCVIAFLVSTQRPGLRSLAILGALLAIFTAVMYGFQVHQALHALGLARVHTTDFTGPAPYVALAGGVLALIGSLVPRGRD
jgi:hypothetical protein